MEYSGNTWGTYFICRYLCHFKDFSKRCWRWRQSGMDRGGDTAAGARVDHLVLLRTWQ